MPGTFQALCRSLVLSGWRRRWLLIVPILVLLPLSLAAAYLMPRSYSTNALLLLQETDTAGPFEAKRETAARSQDQVSGIRALLTSDLILESALRSIHPDKAGDRHKWDELVRQYREALEVYKVSTDFLVVKLTGPTHEGLADELNVILSRLFETLLVGQGGATAVQQAIAWRGQELESARKRFQALQVEAVAPTSAESGGAGKIGPPGDRDVALRQAEEALAGVQERYDTLVKQYAALARRPTAILHAPERVRVIDSPRDPLNANRSRFIYIIVGVATALLLGVALAIAAEMFDDKVHDPEEVASTPAGTPHVFLPYSPSLLSDTERRGSLVRIKKRMALAVAAIVFLVAAEPILSGRVARGTEVDYLGSTSISIRAVNDWIRNAFSGQ